jgi:hypothetical protein
VVRRFCTPGLTARFKNLMTGNLIKHVLSSPYFYSLITFPCSDTRVPCMQAAVSSKILVGICSVLHEITSQRTVFFIVTALRTTQFGAHEHCLEKLLHFYKHMKQ